MHNRSVIVGVALFILIIVGMFTYTYLKRSELSKAPSETTTTPVQTTQPGPYDNITHIDAKHFYIDGKHTIVGEIPMPTPCDLLNWTTSVQESQPVTVIVDFSVINNADTCAQTVTPQRFKVAFDAPEDAVIRARLQGRDVDLNLIPAAEGETPDDYELFIKG